MVRTERLLELLQLLRHYRRPVSAHVLAQKLNVSIRTLYRDIASLQSQGAQIEGEPGLGYVMKPGFMLPPLMFDLSEIEALVLGVRLVAEQGDPALAQSALRMLEKISAVLPSHVSKELHDCSLLLGAGRSMPHAGHGVDIELLRSSIRQEKKVKIRYLDVAGEFSERTVWPFALVYFDQSRVLMCWCEQRDAFRSFRADRIQEALMADEHYPSSRQKLLAQWRDSEYVPGRSLLPEIDSIST
ncbi:helix-turn-helix transcriptional regulator [Pokkaliibacter sp. CJK22405]|uniref:helix-turn-helix transcriptional regulator n=1 Tax=Pokkaliibacter sp. CJK22405 TaxID=3384615 RepID=UPI0039856262